MSTITPIAKKFLPSNNLEMKEVIRPFLTTWTIMNSNTNTNVNTITTIAKQLL